MSMRCGFVAAAASQDDLLAELNEHAGEFTPGSSLTRPYEVYEQETGSLWQLAIGEYDGRTFVLDTSMVLADSADMVLAISVKLGLVVASGAETFSGVYWLTAAQDGELLRHVFVDLAGLTEGMAIGPPLASEAEHPLEGDLDGIGLFAAMMELDLDPRPWLENGPATVLSYDASRHPDDSQIAVIRSEHIKRYGRPEGTWLSEISVVFRESPNV